MSPKYVQSMITLCCVQFSYQVEKGSGKKWDYGDFKSHKLINTWKAFRAASYRKHRYFKYLKLASQSPSSGPFGGPWRSRRVPWALVLVNTDPNFLKNHMVHFRDLVGSNEGPRLVVEPMMVRSCVPRVPWNVFVLLSMQKYSRYSCFSRMGQLAPQSGLRILILA